MASNDSTTLVCLFHREEQAKAAVEDIYKAGIPRSSVSIIDGKGSHSSAFSTLQSLGIPSRDLQHLQQGIQDGGTILAVSAISTQEGAVERIFGERDASKIDEAVSRNSELAAAPPAAGLAAGATAIPIVEEELQVGKRTVDQGGVRVYRSVVEMPAEQSINLREEHVVVKRNVVDRPATQADFDAQGRRTIELTETAEEAVISKNARVVEEVVIGKETTEHTEHIKDSVRRTEVEVEKLASTNVPATSKAQSK